MRPPLTFAWGNVLFGRDADDAWGLYRVAMQPYAGLPSTGKRDVLSSLAAFAYSIEADFQLLRIARPWSVDGYTDAARATTDREHRHEEQLDAYLECQRDHLTDRRGARPALFLAVHLAALREGRATSKDWISELRSTWSRSCGLRSAQGISQRALDDLLRAEDKVLSRAGDFLDCERATTEEIQWLVRRGFTRGVGEPEIDRFWQPQALVIDGDGETGGRFVPLRTDVLRLCDAQIAVEPRGLRAETQHGVSFQACLALGGLPDVVSFPSHQAELLFSPLEALPFDVDAVVCAQWIANDRSIALVRRRVIDADLTFDEESQGDHGPTASGAARPAAARELEDYLTGSERPPLLRAHIGFAVAGATPQERDERVERLRREFAPITLHRPLGAQLDLFLAHLPAQRSRVRDYEDVLTCEQLGAMVPAATHAVGSEIGFYLGHVLSGAEQPVLFDLTEASRTSRPPAILCSGTSGSGKTVTAQLLAYHAFLAGSRVVSVDPKGDHHLAELVGREHVEVIELAAGRRDHGLLDPLRIGRDDTRADLAFSFLLEALPAPVPPPWQTEIRHAVDTAAAAGARSLEAVLAVLDGGDDHARDAARAISIHAGSGLLGLAFADADTPGIPDVRSQVTILRIANLTLPLPGTPRTEMTGEERASRAILRLLAAHALHLMGSDWSRHKLLLFDEAWMLLSDASGRALVQRINRLCRAQNATPILATQVLADVAELEELIGAYLCFGVETDAEAGRALALLHLDADDRRMRGQVQAFRRGRCLLRDYEGRVAPIQVDVTDPALLSVLDTTPRRERDAA